jgi:hypothetical protein
MHCAYVNGKYGATLGATTAVVNVSSLTYCQLTNDMLSKYQDWV